MQSTALFSRRNKASLALFSVNISISPSLKYFVIKSISFILLTITGLSIAVISQEKSKLKAIIKNQNTNIYIGPDEKYPVKDSIEILNCVEILKEQIKSFYSEYKANNLNVHSEGYEKYSRKFLAGEIAEELNKNRVK